MTTTDRISFFVPGVPAPQGSKRAFVVAGRARLVESSKRCKPWREAVSWTAREHAPAAPWEGPIGMACYLAMPRPSNVPKERKGWPATAPDDDKLLRAISDALSGVIYRDDGQRCVANVYKSYAVDGRVGVQIEVWRLECEHRGGRGRDGKCRDCGGAM